MLHMGGVAHPLYSLLMCSVWRASRGALADSFARVRRSRPPLLPRTPPVLFHTRGRSSTHLVRPHPVGFLKRKLQPFRVAGLRGSWTRCLPRVCEAAGEAQSREWCPRQGHDPAWRAELLRQAAIQSSGQTRPANVTFN
ncbi:hypothetical protein NDU88_005999 [Pleurodeles waltl]|uniref:Secreted protein n=1 Tax=Pleurodeles waltl TaxID=8319 RepID=A0AAV7PPD8_PLEWA|nr:hypothetical protein NDU88_005999 [Pleurodeles waltl]